VTIRAKLYAAIVLTVLGPVATTAVALHGMGNLGDSFDEVQQRAANAAVSRELKFLVSEVNSWQTAYGYGDGRFRGTYLRTERQLDQELSVASETFDDPRERELLTRLERQFGRFKDLDAVAWRALQAGDDQRTRQILLGPEIRIFRSMTASAAGLAAYETERVEAADRAFDDDRDDARRRLIAVALGAGIVIVLLLFAANDIARMALEGERSVRRRQERAPPGGDSE
jgi:CHASE3 domain sensor protein